MRKHCQTIRLTVLRVLSTTALISSVSVADAIAQQEAPPHQGPPVRIATAAEALQQDGRSYATEFNVGIDEAVRRLRAQEQQGDVIARLRDANRSRFAGLWIEHQPTFRVVVRLTGDAPASPEFETAAAGSPIPVAFVTNATATESQVLAKIRESLPLFKAALPALMGTDMDVKTGDIVLTVYAVGAAGEAAKAKGAELGRQIGHPVRIELVGAPERDLHTRGGANMSACTSGFVVANSAGTRGIATAGHCGDMQTYYEFGTGVSYAADWMNELRDGNTDVQWHTTTHDEYPEFYADLTTTARVLTGRRYRSSTAVGNTVCHRGMGTGYSCGSVASTTYQPTYAGACGNVTCNSVWIKVTGPNLACGYDDSGGPWFNGQTAFGVSKGGVSSGSAPGQCSYATYMSTDFLSGLGVSLVYGQ